MSSTFAFRCTVRIDVLPTPEMRPTFILDALSSLTALLTALSDLDALCEQVAVKYTKSLRDDNFERWEEQS